MTLKPQFPLAAGRSIHTFYSPLPRHGLLAPAKDVIHLLSYPSLKFLATAQGGLHYSASPFGSFSPRNNSIAFLYYCSKFQKSEIDLILITTQGCP